jgi:HEAT repeat protein
MAIDWKAVAKQIGSNGDSYSIDNGRRALEIVVGEDNLRSAVDYWISQEPGCFVAESVLRIMRPTLAMKRCYEIYKTDPNSEKAISAVFLLASFADPTALPWIREFLDDRNRSIRWNALAVLRTILYGPLADAAVATAMHLIAKAEQDSDPEIRERAKLIRSEFMSTFPYIQLPE